MKRTDLKFLFKFFFEHEAQHKGGKPAVRQTETVITRLTSKWLKVKDYAKGTVIVSGNQKDSEDWMVIVKRGKVAI